MARIPCGDARAPFGAPSRRLSRLPPRGGRPGRQPAPGRDPSGPPRPDRANQTQFGARPASGLTAAGHRRHATPHKKPRHKCPTRPASRRLAKRPLGGRGGSRIDAGLGGGDKFSRAAIATLLPTVPLSSPGLTGRSSNHRSKTACTVSDYWMPGFGSAPARRGNSASFRRKPKSRAANSGPSSLVRGFRRKDAAAPARH